MADVAHHMLKMEPDAKFLIAGDGILKHEVKKKAVSLEVYNRNLWLIPPLPKQDMPALLSAATVAVSSMVEIKELSDTFGNKAFDALAAGKPLVINHRGLLENILLKSGAGIRISYNDSYSAAKELIGFLRNTDRISKARKMARHLADTVYSRDKLASDLIKLFNKVILDNV